MVRSDRSSELAGYRAFRQKRALLNRFANRRWVVSIVVKPQRTTGLSWVSVHWTFGPYDSPSFLELSANFPNGVQEACGRWGTYHRLWN
jgi:hypothetical protein